MHSFIPYGHQVIDETDITAVSEILRSDWLTTGPEIERFEADICTLTTAKYGIAVSSGTAALHAAMSALEIRPGDEVIVPSITFAATANCVCYQGGTPIFVDILPDTLLIDPKAVEAAITPRTKAIIAVDYAGQACNWDALRQISNAYGLALVADACHSLGGQYKNRPVGSLADISVLSFHPVKPITTGEGGMALTDNSLLADKMRIFRNHGITTTISQREKSGDWYYEMTSLGYNYRLTDIQCSLGRTQLSKLKKWIQKRNELAQYYDNFFHSHQELNIRPLTKEKNVLHTYHLYVIRHPRRDKAFKYLRQNKIGANVHYIPVHLHPFYRENFGTQKGLCPQAEQAYTEILTLPLWQGMDKKEINLITSLLEKI